MREGSGGWRGTSGGWQDKYVAEHSGQTVVTMSWHDLAGTPVQFVNHMLLQVNPGHDGRRPDEIFLSFGIADPPSIPDPTQPPDTIDLPVAAVARLVTTRDRLGAMVDALTETLRRYDALQQASAEEMA